MRRPLLVIHRNSKPRSVISRDNLSYLYNVPPILHPLNVFACLLVTVCIATTWMVLNQYIIYSQVAVPSLDLNDQLYYKYYATFKIIFFIIVPSRSIIPHLISEFTIIYYFQLTAPCFIVIGERDLLPHIYTHIIGTAEYVQVDKILNNASIVGITLHLNDFLSYNYYYLSSSYKLY